MSASPPAPGCSCSPGAPASPGAGWSGAIDDVLEANRRWAADVSARDPTFFPTLAGAQSPRYLWIGCSDSRVPANQILDLPPGAVFVHRNVGNLATHKDLNAMSALEYAVSVLKVEHVIVCGHHGCGAVAAALEADAAAASLVNLWVADVRDTRNLNLETLAAVQGAAAKVDRLVELNVVRQVFNVCTAPAVQAAWARGQRVAIHGLVYSLADGLLKELAAPITGPKEVQAHVDDASEPGWPHATRGRQVPPSPATAARGRGVLPATTDCKATTTEALTDKIAAVLEFAKGAARERGEEAAAAAAAAGATP